MQPQRHRRVVEQRERGAERVPDEQDAVRCGVCLRGKGRQDRGEDVLRGERVRGGEAVVNLDGAADPGEECRVRRLEFETVAEEGRFAVDDSVRMKCSYVTTVKTDNAFASVVPWCTTTT